MYLSFGLQKKPFYSTKGLLFWQVFQPQIYIIGPDQTLFYLQDTLAQPITNLLQDNRVY